LPVAAARQFHACTHMTIAPTVVRGGSKTNVIPDTVDLELDIRTLPGQVEADVRRLLDDALGELGAKVEIIDSHDDPSTPSALETPLWSTFDRVIAGQDARPWTRTTWERAPSRAPASRRTERRHRMCRSDPASPQFCGTSAGCCRRRRSSPFPTTSARTVCRRVSCAPSTRPTRTPTR